LKGQRWVEDSENRVGAHLFWVANRFGFVHLLQATLSCSAL
jgi:hypothetical protein